MDHDQALQSQACEKYLLGELSPTERDAFEEHYFSCPECAAQLRAAGEFLGASREIFAASAAARPSSAPVRTASGWFAWLKPAYAFSALAALILFIGYQNLVTIPHYKEAVSPRVLPMHSLITGNTRGEGGLVFSVVPNEPFGLYVDVPADAAHLAYLLRLEDPSGRVSLLRSVTPEEARRTQVVVINPGHLAGKYTLVISGLPNVNAAPPGEELARLQFVIDLRK